MSDERTRFDLQPDEIPSAWFNLMPDIVKSGIEPLPPLSPQTKQPLGPDDLAPLFPMSLIGQEVTTDEWIDIPGEVIDVYRLWRPSPLFRATRLEQALQTPAQIYFKYEGVSPAGSHKPNTAVPQAFYNKQAGIRRIATETGAGQWGSSMAMACQFFGLECDVYMVRASYDQKPYRRIFMETFGARSWPRRATRRTADARSSRRTPTRPGRSASRSARRWRTPRRTTTRTTRSAACSATCCCTSPSIGLEAQQQMAMAGEQPDVVVGCVGGGSNYAGIAYPFMAGKLRGDTPDMRFLATEPAACPTLTKGRFAYDFGDTTQLGPIVPMYTLGHDFVPAPVHAGGLRYHGDSPSLSLLVKHGHMEAVAYTQNEIVRGGAALREDPGHPAGARGEPRGEGRDRRGHRGPRGRRGAA